MDFFFRLHFRCEAKPRCTIPVNASLFTDPCPGTHKYVEVHYTCQPIKSSKTTPKPQPPWLLDLAATPASVTTTTTSTTSTTTAAATTVVPVVTSTTVSAAPTSVVASTSANPASNTQSTGSSSSSSSSSNVSAGARPRDKKNKRQREGERRRTEERGGGEERNEQEREKEDPTNNSQNYDANIETIGADRNNGRKETEDGRIEVIKQDIPETPDYNSGEDVDLLEKMLDHCPPQTMRNLFWNWTENGQDAIQMCPPGASGFARWTCGTNGQWLSETPNLGECQSMWLSRLESRLHALGSIDAIGSELAALTEAKSLYGGDIPIINSIIQGLAHRLRQELYIISSQDGKEIKVSELLQNVLKTASNLIDQTQIMAWKDMPAEKRGAHATNLIQGVEENTLLLAETINNEKNLIEATNNILASIRIMRVRDVDDQAFPQLETVRWEEDSKLIIPASSLVETSTNGAVRLIFFLYNNLENILPGQGVHFINSKILGATATKSRNVQLKNPVLFTLKHLQSENVRNAVCASWDYTYRQWSSEHCSILKTNVTHTVCQCHHISNYAVLMEETPSARPHAASEEHEEVAVAHKNLSTIIACIVAIALCIIIIIIILILVRRFDLKPRVEKFVQANGGIFRCKKSESTTSSCGFYPPLTSSPTSTTVSSGTPTANQTYLEQVLKAHNSEFNQIKPQTPGPQVISGSVSGDLQPQVSSSEPRTIYRATATAPNPNSQLVPTRHLVALNQYDPYGHHIYMEIDPVYAHLESEAHSDIQLSDISDDDLRRNHKQRFAEERPLIRSNFRRSIEQQLALQQQQQQQQQLQDIGEGQLAATPRQCMTTHRLRNGIPTVSSSANNSLRLAQTAQRRPRNHNQQIFYPVSNNSASAAATANLEAPITIALQGGEQFVSLKIDADRQQKQHQLKMQEQQQQQHQQQQQQLYRH